MIPRRAGFSLIEMIVVIALLSAAFTIVSTSLYRATMFSRDVEATTQDQLTLSRLARRLREDAHQAVSMDKNAAEEAKEKKIAGQTEIRLALPDQSVVVYRAAGHQCERVVRRNGERQHHDVFRCSPRIAFTLKILGNDEDRRLLIRAARDLLYPHSPSTDSLTEHSANYLPWVCIEAALHLPQESKP